MSNTQSTIDLEKARQLLQPGGAMSLMLKDYEFRPQQQSMLEDVVKAYHNNSIAIIEAGTGIGKSMAYLIPAILWSAQNKERTLISTNTISLQEQLLYKDIPLASKILGHPIKAVLVKGMSNYLCLRKLDDAHHEIWHISDQEAEELQQIRDWSENTRDGTLKDLPIAPLHSTWERVCAEGDTCTQRRCPHYSNCHFFKARKEAEDAQILVANHSMLFADLAYRSVNELEQVGILPDYTRVILDEAHNVERVATEFFAEKVSYLPILRWMGKLGAERQGKLALLSQRILLHFSSRMPPEASSLHSRLSIDLPGMRKELLQETTDAFEAVLHFLLEKLGHGTELKGEIKMRLLDRHLASPVWQNEVQPLLENLIAGYRRYIQAVQSVIKDLRDLPPSNLEEQTSGVRQEISAFCNRLEAMCQNLENMLKGQSEESTVMWCEAKALRSITNTHLINAQLDISSKLAECLFKKFPTTVLCSATLATNKNFDFIKQRLGLTPAQIPDKAIGEKIYPSPFDYKKQVLLLTPTDMPSPSSPDFTDAACDKIWSGIQACRGNAFVLFTSYSMMKKCYDALSSRLADHRYNVFKQGDANRNALLEQYKTSDRAVLFGTDSFWEGVDVAGEALRCVILVKLPFKVPSEPIIEARTEAIASQGGDPFFDYAVPNAIVKFKQGFGRLVRNKKDGGCIICLDPRLVCKNYGKLFLNSLPHCRQVSTSSSDQMREEMEKFYRRRWALNN